MAAPVQLFRPAAGLQLADFLGVGVAAVDEEGRQIYVNDAFARMVGWDAAALVGALPPFVYWPPHDIERIRGALEQTIRGAAPAEGFELCFRRRDGSVFDALAAVTAFPLESGGSGWVASVADISRQKRQRQEAHEQEQRLALAMDAGRLGAWDWDLTSGRVHWSAALERIHGLEEGAFAGTLDAYRSDIHPDDLERVLSTFSRTTTGKAKHHLEYRIVRPDGEVRWLEAWGQLLHDPQGQPARMVGVCTDVSERVTADERLREAMLLTQRAHSEAELASQELREILEGIGDPFVVYGADWRFRYINRAAGEIFSQAGRGTAESLIGSSLWEVYPDLLGSPFEREMRRSAEERSPVVFEEFYATRQSWSEVRCYPMPDGGTAVVWKDITHRKRAQESQQLLSEASRILGSSLDYEQTLASVARAVVPRLADWCTVTVLDDEGALRRVAVAHVDPERVEWAHEFDRRYPVDPAARTGIPEVIRTGEPLLVPEITDEMLVAGTRDEEHLRLARSLELRSGMTVPLSARGRTLGAIMLISTEPERRYDESDLDLAMEIGRRAGLAVDNARLYRQSERSRERLAEQAEALEAQAGELRLARTEAEEANEAKAGFLATMSHELRTPLNAMIGYAELLLMGVPAPIPPPAQAQVERIARASRHLLSLIDEILTFSRIEAGRETVEISDVDLGELLDEVAAVIEPLAAARGLEFGMRAQSQAGPLRTDPRKLRQILINLLGNAVKFTDRGGVAFEVERDAEQFVFRVHDTGAGMPPEHLERAFEPFWQADASRKRQVQGTGLGLAVSRRLAMLLGGDVSVCSEVGAGSTFELRIPVVGEPERAGDDT
jgi:PAS domain S-box-containing protein